MMTEDTLRLLRAVRDGLAVTIREGEPISLEWGHFKRPIESVAIEGQADVPGNVARDMFWSSNLLKLTSPPDNPAAFKISLTDAGRELLT
jgi:hypothetical protein